MVKPGEKGGEYPIIIRVVVFVKYYLLNFGNPRNIV